MYESLILFSRLSSIGVEYTGDSENFATDLGPYHVMYVIPVLDAFLRNTRCTTPEKFDGLTRKWDSFRSVLDKIQLVMIDEVHCIGDERGGCLEGLITRMKVQNEMRVRSAKNTIRFVALSATICNLEDVAHWLEADSFTFGEEQRPVKLDTHVFGYPQRSSNEYMFDRSLSYKLYDIISTYSDFRPTLIFCSSRKGCVDAGKILLTSAGEHGVSLFESKHFGCLQRESSSVQSIFSIRFSCPDAF
jgi:replicative superfamily II helicase